MHAHTAGNGPMTTCSITYPEQAGMGTSTVAVNVYLACIPTAVKLPRKLETMK